MLSVAGGRLVYTLLLNQGCNILASLFHVWLLDIYGEKEEYQDIERDLEQPRYSDL